MRAMVIGTGRMGRLVREALDERGHTVSAFIGDLPPDARAICIGVTISS